MNEKQELNLESELLKPMRDNFEKAIKILTATTLTSHKETEITLKLNIGIRKRSFEGKEWIEPNLEYLIKEKIKEAKSDFKQNLGINYSIELDDENNVLIENINEQESFFDEEVEEDEQNSDEGLITDNTYLENDENEDEESEEF